MEILWEWLLVNGHLQEVTHRAYEYRWNDPTLSFRNPCQIMFSRSLSLLMGPLLRALCDVTPLLCHFWLFFSFPLSSSVLLSSVDLFFLFSFFNVATF